MSANAAYFTRDWPSECESSVKYEGSRPWARGRSVIYEDSRLQVQRLIFRKWRGGRKAPPEYISQYRKVLVSALERGGPFWATSARFFATLGARTQRNLRGIVALGVRMPSNLQGIVALGARPQRNLRGIVIQGA